MTTWLGVAVAIGVETPIVAWMLGRFRVDRSAVQRILLPVGANVLTYFPFLATLAIFRVGHADVLPLLGLEGVVSVVEGAMYALGGGLRWFPALLVSVLANAASFAAGLA